MLQAWTCISVLGGVCECSQGGPSHVAGHPSRDGFRPRASDRWLMYDSGGGGIGMHASPMHMETLLARQNARGHPVPPGIAEALEDVQRGEHLLGMEPVLHGLLHQDYYRRPSGKKSDKSAMKPGLAALKRQVKRDGKRDDGLSQSWPKRDSGVWPQGFASQLILRSARGARQYDVPMIGESLL